MNVEKTLNEQIIWQKTSCMEFPFVCKPEEDILLKIRINEFPMHPLYTLLENEEVLTSFNNWPTTWILDQEPAGF